MISYNDIQALIAEIDRVLPDRTERVETPPESPTEDNGIEENAQQAVLEKVRWYLLDLRNQIEIEPRESSLEQGGQQQTAMAIASAVMSQLNLHRQDWLQPLHGEVAELRRHRESLLEEIRALEGRHLQLMSDFLQILLGRCSKALQQELSLALEKFETQLWQLQDAREEKSTPTPLQQLDRLQKLRSLQQQADLLVLNLDRTFRKVFESLEGDMQSYHQSLSRGIDEMHELGRQGKTILAAYLQRLNPEMAGQSLAEIEGQFGDRVIEETLSPETSDLETAQGSGMAMFPFAGMEIPPTPTTRELPQGWELEEEGEEIEPVDALFQVNLEEENEASEGLEAWEAWDEHLFHSDELMNAGEEEVIPIVLTLKEAELEVEEEVVVEKPRDLFSGLADPAIVTEEIVTEEIIPEEIVAERVAPEVPADLGSSSPTVEVELFGEPTQTKEEIRPVVVEEDIPSEEMLSTPETDSQTLDEIVGETIASLTELLEEKSEQVEEEEETDEDEVISVAAGETLLATDEVKPQPQADLEMLLDSGQLQTLTEDLANFEGNTPVSEVEISLADIEETLAEEEIEIPIEAEVAIAANEEKTISPLNPSIGGIQEGEEMQENADLKREIHLDAPEINAEMEVDESFEEAFEEEIISEEDEDWMLPETTIAEETENPELEAIAIPPSEILVSLADLNWEGKQFSVTSDATPRRRKTQGNAHRNQSPVTSHQRCDPASAKAVRPRVGESGQTPRRRKTQGNADQDRRKGMLTKTDARERASKPVTSHQSPVQQQLEIVVDDDFELPPSKPVLSGAGTNKNSVPVMRSPQPETTFSTHEDLWDNSETSVPPRKTHKFPPNSKGIEMGDRAVTEIVTDPWSEAPNPSEKKQRKRN